METHHYHRNLKYYVEGECLFKARRFVVKQLDSVEFYEMNWLNESLSMNVFCLRGMAIIPDKAEPNIDRESDASTYKGCTV
jgi:hypothetical protein